MENRSVGQSTSQETESRHQCLIYEGAPSRQLPGLAAVMLRKLREGHRCLYLNSPPMVAGMRFRLAAMGADIVHEVAEGRLVLSSEPTTSEAGVFDVDLMLRKLEGAVDQALSDGCKGLWATGDMTWEFGPEKNFAKLVEYELRLEKLFLQRPALCGVCQYHRDTLPPQVARQGALTHRTFFVNETLSRFNPHYDPSESPEDQPEAHPELDAMISALCQFQNPKP